MGFKCKACGGKDSFVKSTRPHEGGLKRRRICLACGFRFSTIEAKEENFSPPETIRREVELEFRGKLINFLKALRKESGDENITIKINQDPVKISWPKLPTLTELFKRQELKRKDKK